MLLREYSSCFGIGKRGPAGFDAMLQELPVLPLDAEGIPRGAPTGMFALLVCLEDHEALLDGHGFASVAFPPTLVFSGLGGTLREGRRRARGF